MTKACDRCYPRGTFSTVCYTFNDSSTCNLHGIDKCLDDANQIRGKYMCRTHSTKMPLCMNTNVMPFCSDKVENNNSIPCVQLLKNINKTYTHLFSFAIQAPSCTSCCLWFRLRTTSSSRLQQQLQLQNQLLLSVCPCLSSSCGN